MTCDNISSFSVLFFSCIAVHAEFVEICERNYIRVLQHTSRKPTVTRTNKSYPSFLMSTGIPPARGQLRVGLDSGAEDARVDIGEGYDEPDAPLVQEKHASAVKVKPIGKVHTGRLRANIEEEEEGYGGFCNALVYLLKGPVRQYTFTLHIRFIDILHTCTFLKIDGRSFKYFSLGKVYFLFNNNFTQGSRNKSWGECPASLSLNETLFNIILSQLLIQLHVQ